MSVQRRFQPSISSLRALEAVDRLGSAVAAADDLSLTHSAISRQLRALQDQLGVTLFVREGKGQRLTLAGQTYARSIRDNLDDIARASLRLRAAGEAQSLNLAVPLTFGLHWLGPRLSPFLKAHPDLMIHQSTRDQQVDFGREKFDAAVHFGARDWPGVDYLTLAPNRLIPVAAPDIGTTAGLLSPAEILDLPLMHLESRPGAWEAWFEQQGHPVDHLRGLLFDQFVSLAASAASGLGAALLPDFLADREIAAGRLIQIGAAFEDPGNGYHLVWSREHPSSAEFDLLRGWLETRIDRDKAASPRIGPS